MHVELILRFGYGSLVPWVTRHGGSGSARHRGPRHGRAPRRRYSSTARNLTSVADFTIHKGESKSFTLSWRPSHKPAPDPVDAEAALRETEHYWHEWSSKCTYDGEFREPVLRSLLTLKALTYGPTGGIVAAPTTSLPRSSAASATGLPHVLAARCDPHARGADGRGLLRRGARLA
jgi:GH15 family glucan-1,4-alpha-glucosidase